MKNTDKSSLLPAIDGISDSPVVHVYFMSMVDQMKTISVHNK